MLRFIIYLKKVKYTFDKSSFAVNLRFLVLAEIFASLIGFPVKILAGRYLGPVEYGKYALILDVSQFLIIPIVFIRTAAQKYLAERKEEKKNIIGNINFIFFLSSFISLFILYALRKRIGWIINVEEELICWSLFLSLASGLFYVYESIGRALGRYKLVARISIVNSIVIVSLFSTFVLILRNSTYVSYTVAVIASFLFSAFLLFGSITNRGNLFKYDPVIIRKIVIYSSITLIGSLTGAIIGNTSRFFLNKYLNIYWVGVYSAYVNAANMFIGRFFQLFLNVYFPTISSKSDKIGFFFKFIRSYKYLLVLVYITTFISILFVLMLFGSEYPLKLDIALLFSLNMCIYIYYQVLMWTLNSQGVRGVKDVSIILIVNSILNIVLYILFIPVLGIYGVILSTILINIIFSFYFRYLINRYINNNYFYEK